MTQLVLFICLALSLLSLTCFHTSFIIWFKHCAKLQLDVQYLASSSTAKSYLRCSNGDQLGEYVLHKGRNFWVIYKQKKRHIIPVHKSSLLLSRILHPIFPFIPIRWGRVDPGTLQGSGTQNYRSILYMWTNLSEYMTALLESLSVLLENILVCCFWAKVFTHK